MGGIIILSWLVLGSDIPFVNSNFFTMALIHTSIWLKLGYIIVWSSKFAEGTQSKIFSGVQTFKLFVM